MNFLKNIILFIALILPGLGWSQASDTTKFKHELGVDVTSFFEKFFNFTQELNDLAPPTYQATYKRHFKNFSIRAGLGGDTEGRRHESGLKDIDDDILKSGTTTINSRLGVEKNIELGSRWKMYYGLDLRHQYY